MTNPRFVSCGEKGGRGEEKEKKGMEDLDNKTVMYR